MEKDIVKGVPVYRGVTEACDFSSELFYDVDMGEWSFDISQRAFHSNLGSITVCNRMTGFGWSDVESGFRDADGVFWLASGGFNIINECNGTVGDAIKLIKENANTCVAYKR
ncbi:MAG: hypothetical protein ACRDCV_14045 [Plesiomonas shigelloides]